MFRTACTACTRAARATLGRRTLRTALCWGDTSTGWDWAARVLTLSDGASAYAAAGVEGFDELWQLEQLVFRAHSAALIMNVQALHSSSIDVVDVTPRVRRVGRSSFGFACDITAAGAPVASTRGTFVRMDPETRRPAPLPQDVVLGLAARVDGRADDGLLETLEAPLEGEATDDGWSAVVRLSDADSLGHVNNAGPGVGLSPRCASRAPSTGAVGGLRGGRDGRRGLLRAGGGVRARGAARGRADLSAAGRGRGHAARLLRRRRPGGVHRGAAARAA